MNKKYIPIIIVVVAIIGITSVIVLTTKKSSTPEQKTNSLPSSDIVPTVDASVKVTVEEGDEKGYVVLKVEGIPDGTDSIKYEFTYDTKEQGVQGSINDPVPVKGKKTYTKEVFLGTQSGQAKTYHEVVGPIRIALLFNGSYGQQSFEKEFEL